MKKFILSFFVATALAADVAPTFTLLELTQQAETYHAEFLAQQADAVVVEEDERIALSGLLPQASARLNKNIKDANQPLILALSVTQPIVDFSAFVGWRAAIDETVLARINVDIARHALRREVIAAWLDIQLAKDVLGLVEARIKTLREQATRAQILADAGRVTRTDVLSARASLAQAQAQREQAKHDLSTAHDTLQRLTGAGAPLMRLSTTPEELPKLSPLSAWQTRVTEKNPNLAAARQQIVYLRQILKVVKTAAIPNISLSAGVELEDGFDEASESVGLVLSQRLYTGGNVTAQERRVIARLTAARQRLTDLTRLQEQEVRRLHGQLATDRVRMRALDEAAVVSEAVLNDIVIGYNNGVRIAQDVIRAEEDAFDARLQLRRVVYGYLKNLTTLTVLAAEGDDSFVAQVAQFFTPTT